MNALAFFGLLTIAVGALATGAAAEGAVEALTDDECGGEITVQETLEEAGIYAQTEEIDLLLDRLADYCV